MWLNSTSSPTRALRVVRGLSLAVAGTFTTFLLFSILRDGAVGSNRGASVQQGTPVPTEVAPMPQVALVVASMRHENTTWLDDVFWGWQKHVYVVDNPDAPLTTPFNKGRESVVYLT